MISQVSQIVYRALDEERTLNVLLFPQDGVHEQYYRLIPEIRFHILESVYKEIWNKKFLPPENFSIITENVTEIKNLLFDVILVNNDRFLNAAIKISNYLHLPIINDKEVFLAQKDNIKVFENNKDLWKQKIQIMSKLAFVKQ